MCKHWPDTGRPASLPKGTADVGTSAHPTHPITSSTEREEMPSVRTTGGRTGCFSHTDQRSKVQVQMISQQQKAGREEKRFSANGARAKNPTSFHRGAFLNPLHSTALRPQPVPLHRAEQVCNTIQLHTWQKLAAWFPYFGKTRAFPSKFS